MDSVSSLVKRLPVSVSPDTSVREAARIMYDNGVGSVIVVVEGKPVGVFTERDLLKLVATGVSLDARIEGVMSKNVITVKTGDSIIKAATLMSENRIRHLPVVDEKGELVGVISIRDIVDYLGKLAAEKLAEAEMREFTA